MPLTYGLDFGTSNSAIAMFRDGVVTLAPIDPSAANPAVASSVLFIDRAGDSHGATALNREGGAFTGAVSVPRNASSCFNSTGVKPNGFNSDTPTIAAGARL